MLPLHIGKPFFSHATKEISYFGRIIRGGAILSPEQVKDVRKFSTFTDDYVGRSKYVMLSPGLGYVIDNANMKAAFLFNSDILRLSNAVIHKKPAVYEICRLIAGFVKAHQKEKWLLYFQRRSEELGRYDHPLLEISFANYMVEYLSSDNGLTERDEVWGPSAFSEGIINVLYEGNTEYRKELETQIKMFNVSNTVKGEVNIRDYVTKEWKHLNIYRQPTDIPIENEKKAHLQLLIPHSLPLWDTGLIGLCVPPRYLSSVVEALKINGQIIPNAHLSHLFLISGQTSIRISDIL